MIGRCSGDQALARVLVLWGSRSGTGTRVKHLPTAGLSRTLIIARGEFRITSAVAVQELGAVLRSVRAVVEQCVAQHLALQISQNSRARRN
jgi:hypothetical protein